MVLVDNSDCSFVDAVHGQQRRDQLFFKNSVYAKEIRKLSIQLSNDDVVNEQRREKLMAFDFNSVLKSALSHLAGRTDWRIGGTSGGSVEVGTPVAEVSVGVSYLRMPFVNRQTGETFLLQGGGAGGGLALAIDSPLDISITTDDMPGTGSDVFYGPRGSANMSRSDFGGAVLIYTAAVSAGAQGNSGIAVFLTSPIVPSQPALTAISLPLKVKGIASFFGTAAVSSVSIGVSAYQYVVVPTDG